MSSKEMEFYRLEDRVLFEAAAAVEIVEAAENNNDPNANMNEADRQAQEARDAIKNAPPENPAAAAQSDMSDPDVEFQKLIEGEMPIFDTDDLDPGIDALISDIFHPVQPEGDLLHLSLNNNGETVSTGKELVIINSSVMDADTIINELAPNQEALRLEAGSDAMRQILDYLGSADTQYDAIHIVSHGNAGYFVLNGEVFDSEHFDAAEWTAVGEHVTENGDILLYGCNLAESEAGRDFIAQIADASGADVAASTNATGISGDWSLEYSHGLIETTTISVENYAHNLTNYLVSNLNDSGAGSLRQAVLDANANTGADEITFSVNGTITLTSGEIAITDSVTITGNGAANTIISGNNASRVFNITGGTVTLENLTIAEGNSGLGYGGGIVIGNSIVELDNVVIRDNHGLDGGGIYVSGGTVTMVNSTLYGNTGDRDGGGIYVSGGTVTMVNATLGGNTALSGNGGGIYTSVTTVNLLNSIIIGNNASGGPSDISGTVNAAYTVSSTLLAGTANTQSTVEEEFGTDAPVLADNGGSTMTIALSSGSTAANGAWTRINGGQLQYYANDTWNNFTGTALANRNFTADQRGYTILSPSSGSYALNTVDPRLVVNVTHDITAADNEITLREALTYAQSLGNGTVYFSVFINGQTFALTQGQLSINSSVTIQGNGAVNTIISGGWSGGTNIDGARVFNISGAGINVTLDGLTITQGYGSSIGGGGIQVGNGAVANISSLIISGNKATTNGGGIVVINGGTANIFNSTIFNNLADNAGGGIAVSDNGTVNISNSTIYGNTAEVGGGMAVGLNGTATVSNSTISGNTADGGSNSGGGIYVSEGTVTVSNSTVSGNKATANGGGIYVSEGTVNLLNSIVIGNTAPTGADISLDNSTVKAMYNVFGTGTLDGFAPDATNIQTTVAAVFGGNILDNNGGATKTIALTDGSHAANGVWTRINGGQLQYSLNNANWTNFAATSLADHVFDSDQRGHGIVAPSRGAYALNAIDAGLFVTTVSDIVNPNDGVTSLREALAYAATLGGTPVIYFSSNLNGQAITLTSVLPAIATSVTIQGNGAANTIISGGWNGGAATNGSRVLFISSGTVTLDGLTVTKGNSGTGYGGGIYVGTANVTLNKVVVSGNKGQEGGGIYLTNGTLTVTNSTISGNTSLRNGGGIFHANGSTLTLINSTISGNTASGTGGNTYGGGGIYTAGSTATVVDSTIANNTASSGYGGGVFVYTNGRVNLLNSIIIGNTGATAGADIHGYNSSVIVTAAYNVYGVSNVSLDATNTVSTKAAVFGSNGLAYNGGPTQTIKLIDDSTAKDGPWTRINGGQFQYSLDKTNWSDFALTSLTARNITTDQRGFILITPSVGAYSLNAIDPGLYVTTTADNTADDGLTSLREALIYAEYLFDQDNTSHTIYFSDTIDGGTITLLSALPTIDFSVKIQGNGAANTIVSGNNSFRVFNITAGTVTLDGLTITDGNAGSNSGGGIYVSGNATVVNISNSTIAGNTASTSGGGIYVMNSTLNIYNSTIAGNTANNGGGIFITSGTANIADSTITGNTATSAAGGGLYADGTVSLLNNIITGNKASNVDGDIYKLGGTVNGKYNIYGALSGNALTSWTQTNTKSSADDVFENTAPADHVYAIKAGGAAAYKGILVHMGANGQFYYQSGAGYYDAGGQAGPNQAYTTIASSQNGVSRTLTNLAYNAGAYALEPVPDKNYTIVTSYADDRSGLNPFMADVTLREALIYAGAQGTAQTITFATAINTRIITLNSTFGELAIGFSVTIRGNGAANTIVSGGWDSVAGSNVGVRVFNITASTVTLDGLTVTKGNAGSGGGGGIYMLGPGGTLNISNSTISGNTAGAAGGGIAVSFSTVNISNSTISGNTAFSYGGGIYAGTDVTVVNNSTISGNKAGDGGGIYISGGVMTVANSTITGNEATTAGSGIIIEPAIRVSLLNNIIAGNIGSGHFAIDIVNAGATEIYAKYNIYDQVGALVILDSTNTQATADAIFASGGPVNGLYVIKADGPAAYKGTLTAQDTAGNFYYRNMSNNIWFRIGDPNISYGDFVDDSTQNYGLTAAGATVITTSQNNVSRVATAMAYNAGAYALSPVETPSLVVTTISDTLNPFDGPISLREAVYYANNDSVAYNWNGNGYRITFDSTVFGSAATTITLTLGEIAYSSAAALHIDASGARTLTVTVPQVGISNWRVFKFGNDDTSVNTEINITLTNMTLFGGKLNDNTIRRPDPTTDPRTITPVVDPRYNTTAGGVIAAFGNSATLNLNRVTVSGGKANSGGGIYFDCHDSGTTANLTLTDSIVTGNTADFGGGGIYFGSYDTGASVNLTLTGSVVSSNASSYTGGGIYALVYNSGGSLNVTLTESTVSGNTATVDGGGVYAYCYNGVGSEATNNVVLNSSTITGNMAGGNGGGIYAYAISGSTNGTANVTLVNSTVSNNTATLYGGGIYAFAYGYADPGTDDAMINITLADSTITANTAQTGGAIYFNSFSEGLSTANLLNSIILGNDSSSSTLDDIYFDTGTENVKTVNAAYSIYGVIAGSEAPVINSTNSMSDATVSEIFDPLTADGLAPITTDGRAAYLGTLVYTGADGKYYYFDGTNYRDAAGNIGLTTHTVIATSQNGVSRTATTLAYNIGAYALTVNLSKDTVVSTLVDWINPFSSKASLRELVSTAVDGATIGYADGFNTLTLTLGEIGVGANLTLAADFNITGAGGNIFNVASGKTAAFGNITLNNGNLSGNMNFTGSTAGNVTYNGGNAAYSGSGGVVYAGIYGNLSFSGGGSWNISDALTISGDFSAAGTGNTSYLQIVGGNYRITLTGSLTASYVDFSGMNFAAGQILDSWNGTTNTISGSGNTNLTIVLTAASISGNDLTYGQKLSESALTAVYSIRGAAATTTLTLTSGGDRVENVARDSNGNVIAQTISGVSFAGGIYDWSNTAFDVKINPKNITVTADQQSKTYGENDPALSWQITQGNLVGSDTLSGALSRASGENVDTYAITQGTLNNSNYAITFVGNTLTITQRAITVTADQQSKTYGENDPALSWQITKGNLVGSDTLSGALSRAAGENVGAYAITQGTLDNGNYTITFVGNTLTITQRSITVTADQQSKTYGENDPALSWQITQGNLVGGDTLSGTLSRVAGENVDTYAITQGTLNNGNYAITFVGNTLTITQRAITVTADQQSKTYGENDPALSWRITEGNLVGSDTLSGALNRAAGENVGTYAITQGTLDNGNYAITFVGNTLTITQRSITVTADQQSKIYGENDPALSWRITEGNLVGSDTLSGALSRAAGENVGAYAITQGTLNNGNYAITFEGNILTITQRAITVTANQQSKDINTPDPALTYQYTGTLVNGDSFSGELTRDPGEAAGLYAIKQGTLTLGNNYVITYIGNDLTIISGNNGDGGVGSLYTSGLYLDYTSTLPNMQIVEAMRNSEANFAGSVGNIAFSYSATRSYTEHLALIGAGYSWLSGRNYGSLPDFMVRPGSGKAFESPNDMQDIRADIVELELPGSTREGQLTFGGDKLKGPDFIAGWSRDGVDQLTLASTAETRVSGNAMFACLDEALPPIVRRPAVVPAIASDLPELAAVEFEVLDKSDAFKSIFDRAIEELLTV